MSESTASIYILALFPKRKKWKSKFENYYIIAVLFNVSMNAIFHSRLFALLRDKIKITLIS